MMLRVTGACLLILVPQVAFAQLVVDPSGTPLPSPASPGTTAPATAPPNPYAVPGTIGLANGTQPAPTVVVVPRPGAPGQEAAPPPAIYLGSGAGAAEEGVRFEGETPGVHVVQKGDTLWDICAYYFGDPWRWPEIWGLNPTITNPHWIYPGDLVRLRVGGPAMAPTSQPTAENAPDEPAPRGRGMGVELRQLAFISTEDLKVSGQVVGSTEEKEMLSARDAIYVDYPAGKPPQVGKKYAIFTPTQDIKHPETGEKIGAFVQVRGELTVLEVKKDKRALCRITQVTEQGVVERGDRVGALKTQFQNVESVPADRSLEAVIAGIIGTELLIGAPQVVFIDRGSKDGLKMGNEMLVVRRGDALPRHHGELSQAGMDDHRFPDNYIASILVVEAGQTTSVGIVMRTEKEILVGDHVLMRRPK